MTTGSLQAIRQTKQNDGAVLFVHGFSGDRDDTWDRFPGLLGTEIANWDIFMIGYATTFLPDVVGVWSADPDLPIIATMLGTETSIPPLSEYRSLAIVAHSMGGLVVQRALLDDPELAKRVRHLIMFGTPSAGLRKASWLRFWKRQLRNMAKDGDFVNALRSDWTARFGESRSFDLTVVAGAKDQFVPPESSLHPFDRRCWRVVPGDHLSMVKPDDPSVESVRLLKSILSAAPGASRVTSGAAPTSSLRLAAEQPTSGISQLIREKGDTMSEPEVVEAALALERNGRRQESIALLERYQTLGTDVQGTLAGRIKRLWLQDESSSHALRALELYQNALGQAQRDQNDAQVYYHAINVAFLRFVAFDDRPEAHRKAALALRHCERAERNVWNVATQAEACLYLDDLDRARDLYRQVRQEAAQPWQLASASQQAARVAGKLDDRDLAEDLDTIFTPEARKTNKIFVSYSHRDEDWLTRLRAMMAPYLREAESELVLWVDHQIEPGEEWRASIKTALSTAGVAVVLVSADFLASSFVIANELPEIIRGAKGGELQLLWVYLSPAAYEATDLQHFQAAYDLKKPLTALSKNEQDQALLEIARTIKQSALGATERFKT